MEGFLKIPRSFFDSEDWSKPREFSEFEAKLYLLEKARYSVRSASFTNHRNGRKVTIRSGQMLATNRYLMEAWQWRKTRVVTFLKRLVEQSIIRVDVTKAGSVITVLDDRPPNRPPKAKKATAKMTTKPTAGRSVNQSITPNEQPPNRPPNRPPTLKKPTAKPTKREESNKEESIYKKNTGEFDNSQVRGESKEPTKDCQSNEVEGCVAKQAVNEIVEFLNSAAERSFRASTEATVNLVAARIGEGYTVGDFKAVIQAKVNQWKGDPKRARWLRPSTLFEQTHFENYLQESKIQNNVSTKPNARTDFDRYAEYY